MGWRKKGRAAKADLITATEIACYVYCPEQWRLEYGLGLPAKNQAAKAEGRRHHTRKTIAEWLAGVAIILGQVLLAVVFVLLVLLWLTKQ